MFSHSRPTLVRRKAHEVAAYYIAQVREHLVRRQRVHEILLSGTSNTSSSSQRLQGLQDLKAIVVTPSDGAHSPGA
jgi:hypothetical protein